ncbi:hypothetical protein B0T19DRAFT_272349 [Cercophora scortea]|uniref:Exonuclease 1 n=1 Tax=Cercophora scortea TaxID=314031 RepID=A0AAE0I784_9PEZI|nr:hypothetical protein B0T19DRAFT_272349 [Cercophora scortea]
MTYLLTQCTAGLLPLLKSIHRPIELKKYAGETFGIDGYGWLHRGAVACAVELAQGKPTRKYVDFAMHRVRMFKHFGVTPYLVFDGDYLPSKAGTEASRESRREACKKTGLELLRAGKQSQAYLELQKAIDVTPEMARHLIEELKKANIPYVVAPYEADAQLVYLERQGLITGIVSEDSDLLVFGAKRLLTKMDQYGHCIEINRKDFCGVREISLTGWTDTEFRHMAIFSGCDYLDSVSNMGLKTAYRMIRKHKTPERVIKMLQFDGKHRIPDNYLADFKQAELTFLYQRVFCPVRQENVFLTEPDPSVDTETMPFIGAAVEVEVARAIARGDMNPITRKLIVVPPSPSKRKISQVFGTSNVVKKPFGKPIDEYFADKSRIPLGEMDPNCFDIQTLQNASMPAQVPRPLVFPLPRPYVEGAEAIATPIRHYSTRAPARRKSEPVSKLLDLEDLDFASKARRRTAGPTIQVYNDSESSIRPPKKPRLCEDLPTEPTTEQAPEKSKYFMSSKPKKPAARQEGTIPMSDDSLEEALQNLPDFDSWHSAEPTPRAERAQFFDSILSGGQREDARSAESVLQDDSQVFSEDIEVPASSPLEEAPVKALSGKATSKNTPLGGRLQKFCYSAARPGVQMVHGLPTPSSSMQKLPQNSSQKAKASPKTKLPTPMLTPLQRMGAQTLRGGSSRSFSSTSRSPKPVTGRKSSSAVPLDPTSVPLPKVDVAEVEALNQPCGSEDQIIPESDGENELDCSTSTDAPPPSSSRRLNLSRYLYA